MKFATKNSNRPTVLVESAFTVIFQVTQMIHLKIAHAKHTVQQTYEALSNVIKGMYKQLQHHTLIMMQLNKLVFSVRRKLDLMDGTQTLQLLLEIKFIFSWLFDSYSPRNTLSKAQGTGIESKCVDLENI